MYEWRRQTCMVNGDWRIVSNFISGNGSLSLAQYQVRCYVVQGSPCKKAIVSQWLGIVPGVLSQVFSTEDKPVQMKGRGYKLRLPQLIEKYIQDDKRALEK